MAARSGGRLARRGASQRHRAARDLRGGDGASGTSSTCRRSASTRSGGTSSGPATRGSASSRPGTRRTWGARSRPAAIRAANRRVLPRPEAAVQPLHGGRDRPAPYRQLEDVALGAGLPGTRRARAAHLRDPQLPRGDAAAQPRTRSFLRRLPRARVWITETGGIVRHNACEYNEDRAARGDPARVQAHEQAAAYRSGSTSTTGASTATVAGTRA